MVCNLGSANKITIMCGCLPSSESESPESPPYQASELIIPTFRISTSVIRFAPPSFRIDSFRINTSVRIGIARIDSFRINIFRITLPTFRVNIFRINIFRIALGRGIKMCSESDHTGFPLKQDFESYNSRVWVTSRHTSA